MADFEQEVWLVEHASSGPWGAQLDGPQELVNVHSYTQCEGRHCCLHNPSDHPLRDAPRNWRGELGIMERLCEHGIGHPDPDDLAYRNGVIASDPDLTEEEKEYRTDPGIHGCDGCCR